MGVSADRTLSSLIFRRRVIPVARRRRGVRIPPPPRMPTTTRVLSVMSSSTSMRRAVVTSDRRANRGIRIGCIPMRIIRRRPRRRRVFSIMRGVPRFPNKGTTLVSCLTGGVGCPAVTRRGNARNHIVMRFIMGGSNDVMSTGITHDISPCLSGRTLHIVGSVPG